MSRGRQDRCPESGLLKRKLADQFTDLEKGHFNQATLPDCNLYNTNTICTLIFGPRVNVARVLPRLLADPRFHCRVIKGIYGERLSIATHQNSATAYRQIWQEQRRETWCANLGVEWERPWRLGPPEGP